MDQFIIGLFLTVMAKLIRNPAHAELFKNELLHIRDGINAIYPEAK